MHEQCDCGHGVDHDHQHQSEFANSVAEQQLSDTATEEPELDDFDLLRYEGDPILAMPTRRVDSTNFHEASECLQKMSKVMARHEDCLGVAAPQVGHDLKIFMFRHGEKVICCINPFISMFIKPQKQYIMSTEGCLSIPNKQYRLKRYHNLKLCFVNDQGRSEERTFRGMPAVVVQHEIDHLKGILISDKGKETTEPDKNMIAGI